MDDNKKVKNSLTTSLIGLIANILLAIFKILIGIITFSIALLADGINNLSDALISILSLIGIKMSNRRASKSHPYGYHRIEYIFSLIMAFVLIVTGIELIQSSISDLINPNTTIVTIYSFIVSGFSILIKLSMFLYYQISYKKTETLELKVLARDSILDSISTTLILISYIIIKQFNLSLDSYLSIIIGLVIILNGALLSIEAISPLIGVIPDKDRIKAIMKEIKEYNGVFGVHDCLVHSYGNKKIFMSLHLEISQTDSLMVAHDLADKIENEIKAKYNIEVLIHLDPVDINSPEMKEIVTTLKIILSDIHPNLTFHDLRFVKPFKTTKKVVFDVEIPFELKMPISKIDQIVNSKLFLGKQKITAVVNYEPKYLE